MDWWVARHHYVCLGALLGAETMNITVNLSTIGGNLSYTSTNEQTIDIASYMARYCQRVDNAIIYYILIYVILTVVLMLLYRFGKLSVDDYALWSNKLQASYLMMSLIILAWLLVRNFGWF
jgi:hypothetical protein